MDAAHESRPQHDEECRMQLRGGRGLELDPQHRRRRRIVEQEHRLREQPVAAGDVHDAPAAKQTPHTPGHFPRSSQFLARQASRFAHCASNSIEQALAVNRSRSCARQPALGGGGKRHLSATGVVTAHHA